MKTTSILNLAVVASLTVLFAGLIVTQDALISTALFAATVAMLIALHDYSPRKYFVVTSLRSNIAARHPAIARFPGPRVAPRRKVTTPRVSVPA